MVLNAIRNGVRDGMVQFSINDIAQRNEIAKIMESEVDSALVTQPRAGGRAVPDRHRDRLLPPQPGAPAQVVQAINNKIAQEQQIADGAAPGRGGSPAVASSRSC